MNTDKIKAEIRKRHNLDADAPVGLKSMPAVVKAAGEDSHKFTARISTAAIDRDDEVMIPAGMISTDFEKSGTIFWNHDYDKPIGIAGSLKRDEDGIVASGNMFMKRPDDYQGEFLPDFARAFVEQSVKAGKMPGVSVGFIPVETRPATKADREKFGPGVRAVHSKWKMLEFSIAPLQANQEAVVLAVGKSLGDHAVKALGLTPARKTTIYVPMTPGLPVVKRRKQTPPVVKRKPDIQAIVRETVAIEMAKLKGELFG